MSDCHSSFGPARSKRRSGCSRPAAPGRASRSPSSWRIRRTTLSDTPNASKRRSTSAIRLVPYSGCSRFSPATASRRGSGAFGFGAGRGCGNSASTPPIR